jgi:hypothetical protein
MDDEQKRGFFAFPSNPSLTEVVEEAIEIINNTRAIEITSWRALRISGKTVITEICRAIDQAEVFLADLTYLNPNVLFELGFAIAKNKRICIFLDPSIERSKNDFGRFNLSTLGYSPYSNSDDLVSKYFRDSPHENISETILAESQLNMESNPSQQNGILYLKSPIDTQASVRLSHRITKSPIKPLVVDDPQEIRMQLHSWYVKESFQCNALVGHVLSNEQTGYQLHNCKVSFAAGLAHGFGKHVLILAHEPYDNPFDYRHLLMTHRTAVECDKHINWWLQTREQEYIEKQRQSIAFTRKQQTLTELQSIVIGDYVAEREIDTLSDYFVDTAAYKDALRTHYSIFIGRKGTGKTAILYQLRSELGADRRNHTCIIAPVAYELSGIVSLIKRIKADAERGYLVQSIWKYLIYSELAKSLYTELKDKPTYYEFSKTENELITFIEQSKDLFLEDFAIRLEYVVDRCAALEVGLDSVHNRIRVSELLHDSLIAQLRSLLINVLSTKNRAVVLIDNLDKSWKQGPYLEELAEFLLGLLSVSNRVADELNTQAGSRRRVDFSIIIFLRSDIFAFIYKAARERDKILYMPINWEDPELLSQVISRRIQSKGNLLTDDEIWKKYFCPSMEGLPTRDFILRNVLPLPRDIIYWVKTALVNALSRQHSIIEEQDVLDALVRYSQHAFDSLIVENGISIEDFETLMYEFAGMRSIIAEQQIEGLVQKANLSTKLEYVINLLCERAFLGREVDSGVFRYQYNYLDSDIIMALERKFLESKQHGDRRFEINLPFRKYLEIK